MSKEQWASFNTTAGEIFYILIALVFLAVGISAYLSIDKNNKKRYTTLLFG